MNTPLVSVICLCYNHAAYVVESLASVQNQSYSAIEMIVVDDASTDNSSEVIEHYLGDKPEVAFIKLSKNVGSCTAFNQALAIAKGKYVIDLATDDVLLPHRIETQVKAFESLPADYAVVFSDAYLIDEGGKTLRTYYPRDTMGKLKHEVPTGKVYQSLLKRAFICTPTMMMRKSVLDELGGYDEALSYEDYDFWVRSGRDYRYHYQDEILTKKRLLSTSMRMSFYKRKHNPHLVSTLKICHKAHQQNQTKEENHALAVSVRYHLRQALFMELFGLAMEYGELLQLVDEFTWKDRLSLRLAKWNVRLFYPYKMYLAVRAFVS